MGCAAAGGNTKTRVREEASVETFLGRGEVKGVW